MLPERLRSGLHRGPSHSIRDEGKAAAGRAAANASTAASLVVALGLAVAGCRATAPGAGVAGAAVVAAPSTDLSFQADLAPVTALAFADPFLWIGSARGLRRFRMPAGPNEWMTDALGNLGRQVTALAVDGAGRVLVATETGVSALEGASDPRPRVVRLAPLTAVTHLAAVPGKSGGNIVYAGNAQGVFVVDGGAVAPAAGGAGAPVTSMDVDVEGKAVWVGLRGRGVARVEGRSVTATFGASGAGALDFAEPIGVAALPNGTRVALGRSAAGATRLLALRADGPELLIPRPDLDAWGLVPTPGGPLLLAGPRTSPRAYRLGVALRGESVDGGVRFSPERKNLEGLRLAATPEPRALPAEATVAIAAVGAAAGDATALLVGTRAAGVARVGSAGAAPEYLPIGELATDAQRLSVACLERERCVVSTGAGPGWIWDGRERTVKAIPDGAIGGGLMALAGDGSGTVYFVTGAGAGAPAAAASKGGTLSLARLSADGGQWEHLLDVPVAVEGKPVVGFATLSPKGDLWMTVRDRAASGQELGRGVLEVRLPSGRATHHRPYTAKETAPADAIPVTGDVAAIRFQAARGGVPDAIWFCTASGVLRFAGGNLERWGENEGLTNEHCNDLTVASDGTVWIATEAGAARFDGKQWVPASSAAARAAGAAFRWPVARDGEDERARALVTFGQVVWAGTPKGVWSVNAAATPLDRRTGLFDDDVIDVVGDRFGRLWILGHVGLTIRPSLSDISHL